VKSEEQKYQPLEKASPDGVLSNRFGLLTTGSFARTNGAASKPCRSKTSFRSASRAIIGAPASTAALMLHEVSLDSSDIRWIEPIIFAAMNSITLFPVALSVITIAKDAGPVSNNMSNSKSTLRQRPIDGRIADRRKRSQYVSR
jgi:hypothetical protein